MVPMSQRNVEPGSEGRNIDREGREEEVVARARRRIGLGLVIGPALGAVAGFLIALAFGAPGWALGIAAAGGAIFGALGAFWGGLSSLRPPASDDDPLEAGAASGTTDERPLTVRRDPD